MSLRKLFYSKQLHPEVKLICYLLLIRPIITYGCPIWYNISASLMEKIRSLERKCLRACPNLNRSAESDYMKYVSNKALYDTANIPHINNFIIGITRDHFLYASKIYQNSLVFSALYPNPMYFKKTFSSGFIPPEAFPYLDHKGYIQDLNYVPIIYHFPRHSNDKKIKYPENSNSKDTSILWRYNMDTPDFVKLKKKKDRSKYWWNLDPDY
ncbi:hypothetical protein ALC57_11547 [Trachymyrmex cornetzi]|uniref:Uncharacterized protein n=1 Tax=Trachymyrmex cornetzi TaxID=471704 RepID=A0A151J2D6_9HYME|nr:hypothetical protein ALC57_11547 [Trachymyrmex cornetzi]